MAIGGKTDLINGKEVSFPLWLKQCMNFLVVLTNGPIYLEDQPPKLGFIFSCPLSLSHVLDIAISFDNFRDTGVPVHLLGQTL